MLKRTVSLLLTICLLISVFTIFVPAQEVGVSSLPLFAGPQFSDVKKGMWFYDYVTDLSSKGIINGYPDKTFKPNALITRAEFIKLLTVCMGYELSSTQAFDDVHEKDWFYPYVSAAVDNGIISKDDYNNGLLRPNGTIWREEVAKMIVKAVGAKTGVYASPYADTNDQYVIALYALCLMQGSIDDLSGDRYFFPKSSISRAESSTVLSRLLEYVKDPEKFIAQKKTEYNMPELKLLVNADFDYNNAIKDIGKDPMSFRLYFIPNGSTITHNDFSNSLLSCYFSAFSHYPQLFTFTDLQIEKEQTFTGVDIKVYLTSKSQEYSISNLFDYYNKAKVLASDISSALLEGKENLSDFEKAEIFYDYLIKNTQYPKGIPCDIDYTAYGALVNNQALCQGYCSAFNLLCLSANIDVCSIAKDNHSWCAVKSGGIILYYDVAYEDSSSEFSQSHSENGYNLCGIQYEKVENLHGKFSLPLEIFFNLE